MAETRNCDLFTIVQLKIHDIYMKDTMLRRTYVRLRPRASTCVYSENQFRCAIQGVEKARQR